MKKPNYIAYVTHENAPVNGGEKQTYWLRVGAAFTHEKGNGLNIVLTPGIAVTSGKIVLLEPKDNDPSGNPLDFDE